MKTRKGRRRSARRRAALLRIAALALTAAPGVVLASDPRIDFMLECQGCHLADGSGKPGEIPSLRDSVARFLDVPGGREFIVQVPGSALSPLDDTRLAGVLNWMLEEFGPPAIAARATPYDAAEVGRLRASPLIEVAETRAALIQRIEAAAP